MLCHFGFLAHPAFGGSGFPLQFLSLPTVGLRDFRFNPLRESRHQLQVASWLGKRTGERMSNEQ
jgi:hypothetical protein